MLDWAFLWLSCLSSHSSCSCRLVLIHINISKPNNQYIYQVELKRDCYYSLSAISYLEWIDVFMHISKENLLIFSVAMKLFCWYHVGWSMPCVCKWRFSHKFSVFSWKPRIALFSTVDPGVYCCLFFICFVLMLFKQLAK